jgi:hypothetical protein
MLIGGEAGDLTPTEDIPHNRRLPSIETDGQSTGSTVADVVDGDPQDMFAVKVEAAFNGQGIVMEDQDLRPLGV